MQNPHNAELRIIHLPVRMMLIDANVTVHIDGSRAYTGSFKKGFDVKFPIVAGRHSLSFGIQIRSRVIDIEIYPEHTHTITLKYSRAWGNFTKNPKIEVTSWAQSEMERFLGT
jgi:hypothetical protein